MPSATNNDTEPSADAQPEFTSSQSEDVSDSESSAKTRNDSTSESETSSSKTQAYSKAADHFSDAVAAVAIGYAVSQSPNQAALAITALMSIALGKRVAR